MDNKGRSSVQAEADIDLYSGVGNSAGLSGVAEEAHIVSCLVYASCKCPRHCGSIICSFVCESSCSCLAQQLETAPLYLRRIATLLAIAIVRKSPQCKKCAKVVWPGCLHYTGSHHSKCHEALPLLALLCCILQKLAMLTVHNYVKLLLTRLQQLQVCLQKTLLLIK